MKHSISSHATRRQKGITKLCQSSSWTTQAMQYLFKPFVPHTHDYTTKGIITSSSLSAFRIQSVVKVHLSTSNE